MTLRIIDTATPLTLDACKAFKSLGFAAVARYLQTLTRQEIEVIHSAGLGLVVIYETTPTTSGYFTHAKGSSDAAGAAKLAHALDMPAGVIVNFTADADPAILDLARIDQYLDGIQSVMLDHGMYGGYGVIEHAAKRPHPPRNLWQASSWSYGAVSKHATMLQDAYNQQFHGVLVDEDSVFSQIGWWMPPNKEAIPMSDPTIRRGASGPWVEKLQRLLDAHGAAIKIDGQFGPATQAAVRNFQHAKGLVVDGVVGRATWAALEAVPAVKPTPAPAPKPTPAPVVALKRKDLTTWHGDVLNNGFFFDLPVSVKDPTVKAVGKMQFDTGAFEILIAKDIADSIGLPDLGPEQISGVGGAVQAYTSQISVLVGDQVIVMPCVVDPQWSGMAIGLFGLRGLIENKLNLDMCLDDSDVTLYQRVQAA